MQSLFYLTEDADAHYRHGKLNLALKKYLAINKVQILNLFHSFLEY